MASNNNFKNRPSNYVIFTLMAITAGEMRFSQAGHPFAFTRAFLSQGKDKTTGEYKPSLFFDVKAFSKDDSVTALVQSIADVQNKERFTVKGRMGLEEWTGQDGEKHQKMVIFAMSIEPFMFDESTAVPEDELEGEPAF
jgi:single-stranded DNA-binding protein